MGQLCYFNNELINDINDAYGHDSQDSINYLDPHTININSNIMNADMLNTFLFIPCLRSGKVFDVSNDGVMLLASFVIINRVKRMYRFNVILDEIEFTNHGDRLRTILKSLLSESLVTLQINFNKSTESLLCVEMYLGDTSINDWVVDNHLAKKIN